MNLDDVFQNYSPAFLQDFLTVLTALKQEGMDLDEILKKTNAFFHEAILGRYQVAAEQDKQFREFKFNAKRCPACGAIMHPYEVNKTPCSMVGGGYKSCWACSEPMECGEVEYSELTIKEEIEKHGLSPFYAGPPPAIDANQRRRIANFRARSMRPREFRIKSARR